MLSSQQRRAKPAADARDVEAPLEEAPSDKEHGPADDTPDAKARALKASKLLVSGLCYCVASGSMVLLNKQVRAPDVPMAWPSSHGVAASSST
jgi:hypothetical protein